MKRRIWILTLLVLCAVALPLLANAETSGTCGASVIWTLDDDGLLTVAGNGSMTSAPWVVTDINEVVILDGVTTVCQDAFSGADSLTKVSLPATMTAIGNGAFSYCIALTDIDFPAKIGQIGDRVFSGCDSLTVVDIPATVTSIGSQAFADCGSLTDVTIPGSVRSIGNSAFSGCANLTDVTISDGVNSIGMHAFQDCCSLEEITLPNSISNVDYQAFANCSDLSSVTVLAMNVQFDADVFVNCDTDLTVACYTDATAVQDYANANNIPVKLLDEKPGIISQPESIIANEWDNVSFSVSASGDNLQYQWMYCNPGDDTFSTVEENGQSDVLNVEADPNKNGIQFCCYVYNEYGAVFTDSAVLQVVYPIIVTQPEDLEVKASTVATFSVTAHDEDSTYQWYRLSALTGEWEKLEENATSATYSFIALPEHDGNGYWCQVTGRIGEEYSNVATLSVITKPTIDTQPVSVRVIDGTDVVFTVSSSDATGYQWYYRTNLGDTWMKVPENGGTNSYAVTAEVEKNGYQFCCKVSNSVDSTLSAAATLEVFGDPVILEQPVDKTVLVGETASFMVKAKETDTYQWYYRSSPTGTWRIISYNATFRTYTLVTKDLHDGWQFRCLLKNEAGSVYTDVVNLHVITKPVITMQPSSVRVSEGTEAVFAVTATGADSYQWYYRTSASDGWTKVSRAVGSVYSLIPASQHDGFQFRCRVKNAAGYVYTKIVHLYVDYKPIIIVHPSNTVVNEDDKAKFKVEVQGKDLTFQWYRKVSSDADLWEPISGATFQTCTVTANAGKDGSLYRCGVTNSEGTVYSKAAKLRINLKPVITVQPTNVNANEDAKATFKLKAAHALTYQWYYRTSSTGTWKAVDNKGNTSSYSLTPSPRHNGYQFRCLVKNNIGKVFSNTVTLSVLAKPVIKTEPKNVTTKEGDKATFTVAAKGSGLTYQWYYRINPTGNWTAIKTDGDQKTYSMVTSVKQNGYQYRCRVKNAAGAIYTKVVTLVVYAKPVITSQPKSVKVKAGEGATFKVSAKGSSMTYQWYYRNSATDTWKKITKNADTNTYKVVSPEAKITGRQFRCLVKNKAGSVFSNPATLTVENTPYIKTQPSDATAQAGKTVTFKVTATNTTSYKWYYRTSSTGTWKAVSAGGGTSTYKFEALAKHNGYQFRCLLKNANGSVYTAPVTLIVWK